MKYHMHFSIEEIENLTPFERDVYISLFNKQKEKEKKENDGQSSNMKGLPGNFNPNSMRVPSIPKMPSMPNINSFR